MPFKVYITRGRDYQYPEIYSVPGKSMNLQRLQEKLIQDGIGDGCFFYEERGNRVIIASSKYSRIKYKPDIYYHVFGSSSSSSSSNQSTVNRDELLLQAVKNNSIDTVRHLLDQGANPNMTIEDGNSLIVFAAHYQLYEIMDILLGYGANINSRDKKDHSSLPMIVQDLDYSRSLIERGADINASDIYGETLLFQVIKLDTNNRTTDYFEYLVLRANPNLTDRTGSTPLMLAVFKGEYRKVKQLLEHGADISINVRDNEGLTAEDLAQILERDDLVKLLQSYTPIIKEPEL